ncbi:MAG: DHHA1 domain-containing protein [Anaerolineales bacterium]
MTTLLYYDYPLLLSFSAEVTETFPLPGGNTGALLRATAFYPTGGGQEHDTGFIGEAAVLDVYKDESGRVIHVIDRPLAPGEYPARVDSERRLRAMQHHTAQHLLSAALLRLFDLESVSANINGYTPSTVDLAVEDLPAETLRRAEEEVNGIIFENRPVKTYFVDESSVASLPLRKPPKVSGQIRIVEIEGYDYTPCGGTHCPATGSIGLLKIVRTERINHKLRLHFVAGWQAFDVFRLLHDSALRTSDLLSARPEDLPALTQKLLDQAASLRAENESLRAAALEAEARQLAQEAEAVGATRLVTRLYRGRSPAELRTLAGKLAAAENLVAVLASLEGEKLSLVVAAAPGSGVDARDLLNRLLGPIGGRGGGDARLAQGGVQDGKTQPRRLFEQARRELLAVQASGGEASG